MRTTIVIDDHLLREAKQRAGSRGITLSELVNEALRDTLFRPITSPPAFEMITYGDEGTMVHREPGDFARALEDDERKSVGR